MYYSFGGDITLSYTEILPCCNQVTAKIPYSNGYGYTNVFQLKTPRKFVVIFNFGYRVMLYDSFTA